MHAASLMSQPVITCHVNDPLYIAAQRMWDHDCGVVAVVNDDGKLVGMVTDRDICMAAYTQGRPLDSMLVNSAMSKQAVSTHALQPLEEIAQLMARYQIRRVPVIDDENRPIGMVSLNDLARESVKIKMAAQKVADTLAAVCTPRVVNPEAA